MAPHEARQKPYALLYDTLKRTGYVGVAKIAMHNVVKRDRHQSFGHKLVGETWELSCVARDVT